MAVSRDEILEPLHFSAVFRRYGAGELEMQDVVDWADAIEVRDDVGRPETDQGEINQALFELATPELFAGFDEIVHRWRESFRRT